MVLSLRTASLDRSRRDLVHIGLGKVDIVWAPNLYPGAIMLSMARRDSLHMKSEICVVKEYIDNITRRLSL